MKTRICALVLSLLLLCSLGQTSVAVSMESPEQYAADLLYELGLFNGVGKLENGETDFDLVGTPTREVAVVMLVRLLGKETSVQRGKWESPFRDVSDWAKPYVAYAYEKGLTQGLTEKIFGGEQAVTAAQYLTFVLRALGYSSETDFDWQAAWDLSNALGMTYGEYDQNSVNFNRGDVAIISAAALGAPMKESEETLLSYLNSAGALKRNDLVLLDVDVLRCEPDQIELMIFGLKGTPNVYQKLEITAVSVNGLPCSMVQYKTYDAIAQTLPTVARQYPTGMNVVRLDYDEALAKDSAEHYTDLGGGNTFPILIFAFEAKGTLPSGKVVTERFSEALYIDGYGTNH